MGHILLAEDDRSMRDFLALALTKAGHTVTAHDNGLDALSALEDQPEDGKGYDLLLTDIVMPGMDGIELARMATKKRPELKVMFITGFAAVAMDKKSERPANAHLLSKPFHLKDLVRHVNELLAPRAEDDD